MESNSSEDGIGTIEYMEGIETTEAAGSTNTKGASGAPVMFSADDKFNSSGDLHKKHEEEDRGDSEPQKEKVKKKVAKKGEIERTIKTGIGLRWPAVGNPCDDDAHYMDSPCSRPRLMWTPIIGKSSCKSRAYIPGHRPSPPPPAAAASQESGVSDQALKFFQKQQGLGSSIGLPSTETGFDDRQSLPNITEEQLAHLQKKAKIDEDREKRRPDCLSAGADSQTFPCRQVKFQKQTKLQKFTSFITFLKTMLLCGLWAFCVYIFIKYKEADQKYKNTFAAPQIIQNHILPYPSPLDKLSVFVSLLGPFMSESDEIRLNKTERRKAKNLTVWIAPWYETTKSAGPPIEIWNILLKEDGKYDYTSPEKRELLLEPADIDQTTLRNKIDADIEVSETFISNFSGQFATESFRKTVEERGDKSNFLDVMAADQSYLSHVNIPKENSKHEPYIANEISTVKPFSTESLRDQFEFGNGPMVSEVVDQWITGKPNDYSETIETKHVVTDEQFDAGNGVVTPEYDDLWRTYKYGKDGKSNLRKYEIGTENNDAVNEVNSEDSDSTTEFHKNYESHLSNEHNIDKSDTLNQVTLYKEESEELTSDDSDTSTRLLVYPTTDRAKKLSSEKFDFGIAMTDGFDMATFLSSRQYDDIISRKKRSVRLSTDKYVLRVKTDAPTTVPFSMRFNSEPLDDRTGVLLAFALVVLLYIFLITEIIHRTLAAMIVSTLSLATISIFGERPSLQQILSWIDEETMMLLFSMMLLVAIVAETGLFDCVAFFTFQKSKGKLWRLIITLCGITALFSSILNSVNTVLFTTHVTIRLCEVMQLEPTPILIFMTMFSNIGGAATPVGDPPNIHISTNKVVKHAGINFLTYTEHMSIAALLALIQTFLMLRFLMFRSSKPLKVSRPDIAELRHQIQMWKVQAESINGESNDELIMKDKLMKKIAHLQKELEMHEKEADHGFTSMNPESFRRRLVEMKKVYKIRDKVLLAKFFIVVAFLLTFFFLHAIPSFRNMSIGWTALMGAILLLILADRGDISPILQRIEWSTLVFFASFFVMMEVLAKLGLISYIARNIQAVVTSIKDDKTRLAVAILMFLWVSGLVSAFVDNIPLTAMMIKVLEIMAKKNQLKLPLQPLVWAMALGACLGGNGTIYGASANIVCAAIAEQHGYKISFMQYFLIGFPIMLVHLIVCTAYLLIAHVVLSWHP